MSRCTTCNAEIRWVSTQSGQRLPLDLQPAKDGNILIVAGFARVIPLEERANIKAPLYKSHFATCPDAESHKFRKGGGRPPSS